MALTTWASDPGQTTFATVNNRRWRRSIIAAGVTALLLQLVLFSSALVDYINVTE